VPVARTWPDSWESELAGARCGKCEQGRPDEDDWGVRWLADEFADAYLLKAPASPGYSVVVFRGRHVPDPAFFTDEEMVGYWRTVRRVGRVLHEAYGPAQINYQCMNNAVAHVHTHVLPRYLDDSGPRTMLPESAFETATPLARDELERQVRDLEGRAAATT
jgi:diadenosine tetraphosphate (Ap4A) HIT family hydrolase